MYVDNDNPRFGGEPHIRAVIEEFCGEALNDGFSPKRAVREVFLRAGDVRSASVPTDPEPPAAFDYLDLNIEEEMGDEEFRRLIEIGVVIPLSAPS